MPRISFFQAASHGGSEPGVPTYYNLTETPKANYLQRIEWNARDSDGTVVFTLASPVTGGSLRTIEFAEKHGKPCIHISKASYKPAEDLQRFVEEHEIGILNVAGSRESKEPGIHRWVMSVLEDALFWNENHPGMIGGPGEG